MTSVRAANPPLTHEERRALLAVARKFMEMAVRSRKISEGVGVSLSPSSNLMLPAGAFVTLHVRNRLRGCIGELPGESPLWHVVAHCGQAAALEDPRFEPVRPDELDEIEIEISVLSPLADTLPEMIEAGKHGILVSRGWQRGVLLPQVATQFHWDSARFLEETCVKAGMDRDAWKDPATRIQTFTAEVFSESEEGSGEPKDGSPQSHGKRGYSSST
jgi:AmmeMemoRadiSam system protein A